MQSVFIVGESILIKGKGIMFWQITHYRQMVDTADTFTSVVFCTNTNNYIQLYELYKTRRSQSHEIKKR